MAQSSREEPAFLPMRRPGVRHGMRGMPAEKPKNLRGTLLRLWRFFGREKRLLALVLLFVVVDAALLLAVPWLIGRGVDAISAGEGKVRFSALRQVVVVLAAFYGCDLLLTFGNNFLMAGVSQRMVRGMRRALFEKLGRIPIAYFDTRSHGELMSRFTNDIDNISTTVSSSAASLMSDVVGIAGSLAVMLALNPLLTLAGVAVVPLVLLLSRTVTKRTGALFKAQQNVLGRLNGQIEESISGLQVVKAFNREQKAVEDFSALNDELLSVGLRAQILSGYLMPLMNIIGNFGFTLVAVAGGVLAVEGMATVGVVASFLTYSKQFSRPLNDVASVYNTLLTAVAGAERIFEVLDAAEESADRPGAREAKAPRGEVEFRDVSFGYRPDVPVLRGLNFHAPAGGTVALVGPTGAGKTTIVSLMNRFYEVTGGSILLDGRELREYTRRSLRNCFGVVLQDTYLFTGTVAENIRYGRLSATDAEVETAAREAGADGFIRRLPEGYDTFLSGGGGSLSQGEKQMLTIARAILADPPILILDEATSSVDTRTEMRIQQAMVRLMKGRTCFVIAHRLSTIRGADVILFLNAGRIAEMGSHEELLRKKGRYYELYRSQFDNTADGA